MLCEKALIEHMNTEYSSENGDFLKTYTDRGAQELCSQASLEKFDPNRGTTPVNVPALIERNPGDAADLRLYKLGGTCTAAIATKVAKALISLVTNDTFFRFSAQEKYREKYQAACCFATAPAAQTAVTPPAPATGTFAGIRCECAAAFHMQHSC
jgi:hypothetical protein